MAFLTSKRRASTHFVLHLQLAISVILFLTLPALGQPSSSGPKVLATKNTTNSSSCGSAPKVAADLWQEFEKQTKEAGCYVYFYPSSAKRFSQCLVEYAKLPFQLGEELIAFWNAMANNEWATIGPRRVEPGINKGTLVSPGNRLWLTSTPQFMDRTSIKIEKRKKADADMLGAEIPLNTKVKITVCSTGPDGNTKVLEEETVLAKEDAGTVLNKSFNDPRPGILSVYLKSKAKVPLTFKYNLEVKNNPKKFNTGPVDGFADIHVHQMADESYTQDSHTALCRSRLRLSQAFF